MSILGRKAKQQVDQVQNDFRTTVFYTASGPETFAVLTAMGFTAILPKATEQQEALAKALLQVGHLLACDRTNEPLDGSVFVASDGSGRLAMVWPSEPSVIVAQVGAPVVHLAAQNNARLLDTNGLQERKLIKAEPKLVR